MQLVFQTFVSYLCIKVLDISVYQLPSCSVIQVSVSERVVS